MHSRAAGLCYTGLRKRPCADTWTEQEEHGCSPQPTRPTSRFPSKASSTTSRCSNSRAARQSVSPIASTWNWSASAPIWIWKACCIAR
ncbi:hypothetical protein CXK90_18320, partial [Stutzerimonas stutzeri]